MVQGSLKDSLDRLAIGLIIFSPHLAERIPEVPKAALGLSNVAQRLTRWCDCSRSGTEPPWRACEAAEHPAARDRVQPQGQGEDPHLNLHQIMQELRMAHALCVKSFRCVHSAIEDGEEGLWHVRSPATHMGQGQVLL